VTVAKVGNGGAESIEAGGVTVGVDVAMAIDAVPAGAGRSEVIDGPVPVQALISTKTARAKTGCGFVAWIFLRRWPILGNLTIRLPTMLDAQDDHEAFILINLVDYAIVTHANAPFVLSSTQPDDARWTRCFL
jgi:hypothetical protein